MNLEKNENGSKKFKQFDRAFFQSSDNFTCIGKGSLGGKANGLAFIKDIIRDNITPEEFPQIEIFVPRLTVICTSYFDAFMNRNLFLKEFINSNYSDERIAVEFQKADLPVEIVGDLRSIIHDIKIPLSVRSSSMLEDKKEEPFAGIYATKMISNNQITVDERFHKLTEAVKYVYASTFFKAAKDYLAATKNSPSDEKMAVIIQEVVGERFNDRFYPVISGVARSFNYYSIGKLKPEQGVVNLALGLGKTIVDGDISWTYSPATPKISPPYANSNDLLKNTQTQFWAVNMGHIPQYDPVNEIEFLSNPDLTDAEEDGTLKFIASTFSVSSNRIVMGIGQEGPRALNFAPILQLNEFGFNNLIRKLLTICSDTFENPVEIEFACTIDIINKKLRFGFLQVRPMVAYSENIEINDDELNSDNVLISSDNVLGNGVIENISDIVFVKHESFDKKYTPQIALEIDSINKELLNRKSPYLLIGYGRWGSSDPWLGIPVEWGQIAGAKVIVETTLPGINVELSQGSHFFHNLTSFKVSYFSIHHESENKIDYNWLNKQKTINEKSFIKHVKLVSPLKIKIDGRTGRGIIVK